MEIGRPISEIAEARRKRGISLEEISRSTRIGMRYLLAIEAGEFEKLPGGVYDTSYIRQYAKSIDYDEFALLAHYSRKHGSMQVI
jgi:cytoskeletal protein RodZ